MSMLLAGPIMSAQEQLVITSLADLFTTQDGFAYEFDDLSTLWQDTSATTAVTTNGDPIARVDDVSGNGYNATQETGSAQPIFNDVTGIRWAGFNGSQYLTIPGSASSLSWTHKNTGMGVAALVRFGTGSNPDALYLLCGTRGSSSANTGFILGYDDRSSSGRNDAYQGQIRGNGLQVASIIQDDSVSANADHSIYMNNPVDAVYGLVDGSQVGSDETLGTPSSSNSTNDFQIGAGGGGYSPIVGRIHAIVARDEEFSTEEVAALETYFASKL